MIRTKGTVAASHKIVSSESFKFSSEAKFDSNKDCCILLALSSRTTTFIYSSADTTSCIYTYIRTKIQILFIAPINPS